MTVRTLDDWLAHAERVHPVGIDMGLVRVRRVAERLELLPPAPQNIVVAGTNGKGSTSVYLEALLLADGRSVGTTLSPHLSRFNERVRVNGRSVDDATLCDAFATIEDARGETTLTYFEFGVLAALLVFRRARVDATVLEVGLGGRLDAVNIVDGSVSVITSIGIDHVGYLGTDRESIGREKAGILRRRVPCVYGEASIPSSIVVAAQMIEAPMTRYGTDFSAAPTEEGWSFEGVCASARTCFTELARPSVARMQRCDRASDSPVARRFQANRASR
jgi:dihydrofolate synthase/folylpolyglutamate synthase